MEQVIEAEAAEYRIRSRIEHEYDIITQSSENSILFQIKEEKPVTAVDLKAYSTAMRRMPPLPGANRLLCMADMVRVDTNILSLKGNEELYHEKALLAALAYSKETQVPFILTGEEGTQLLYKYGFGVIGKRAVYRLNREYITETMLWQARMNGMVNLMSSYIKLVVLRKEGLMTLVHFANSVLCRTYGLFVIRSAVYYEKLLSELETSGGGIYQLMENGRLKGYMAISGSGQIREAVFENKFEMERYLIKMEENQTFVLARITNLSQMLKHVASRGRVRIAIRLKDNLYAENDGLFIWYLDEKGSKMERIEEHEEKMFHPELTVSIDELASFIFGYRKLKENLKFDSIYLSEPVYINEI